MTMMFDDVHNVDGDNTNNNGNNNGNGNDNDDDDDEDEGMMIMMKFMMKTMKIMMTSMTIMMIMRIMIMMITIVVSMLRMITIMTTMTAAMVIRSQRWLWSKTAHAQGGDTNTKVHVSDPSFEPKSCLSPPEKAPPQNSNQKQLKLGLGK